VVAGGELDQWVMERLDREQVLKTNRPANDVDVSHLLRYRLSNGINVRVVQAFGLPGMGFPNDATVL
jgi:hypothetical protein